MKKNAVLLIVFSLILLAAGLFALEPDQQLQLSLLVEAGGAQERIRIWEEEDVYTFFLPAYADPAHTYFQIETDAAVEINGASVTDGMSLDGFELGIEYSLDYQSFGKKQTRRLVFLCSDDVPSLHIDTQSGNMDYIHAHKGNEETGSLRIFDADGALLHACELKYISGRGNSTWNLHEKKPYNLRLNAEANLLDMGSAEKWVLLANAEDPSLMRNKIVYDFADAVGLAYSPESRWVDLYLNGEYAGLYLLCERNEVHANRVDVSGEGSFLVSLELGGRLKKQGYPHVTTDAGQSLRVHYPETAGSDLETVRACWQSIENALLSADGRDPDTGKSWQDLIDLDSWVRKYLIEELFGNIDGCAISQFFYLDGSDPSGRVYAGPVWDYDYSMGSNAVWQLSSPRGFYANRLHVRDDTDTPWFHALYQKPEFRERAIEIYRDEYLPVLNRLLESGIQDYLQEMAFSAGCDFYRWHMQVGAADESARIADFLSQRVDFLNGVWLEGESYVQVRANRGFGDCYAYYALQPGESLGDLPVFEDIDNQHFVGWFYEADDAPYDPNRPVYEDVHVYAKGEGIANTQLNRIGKLIPLGFITIMFLLVLFAEIRRNMRGR